MKPAGSCSSSCWRRCCRSSCGEYYINLASQIFIFAVFAASINLLLGYGGLPTLGHAAYLGVAAYLSGAPVR